MQLILKIISAFKDMFFIFCLLYFKGLEFQPVIKFNFVFRKKTLLNVILIQYWLYIYSLKYLFPF